MRAASFNVRHESLPEQRGVLYFTGGLSFRQAFERWDEVRALMDSEARDCDLDLSGLTAMDGGSAALLVQLRCEIECRGGQARLVGAQGDVARLLALYGEHEPQSCFKQPPCRRGILDQIGEASLDLGHHFKDQLEYAGLLLVEFARALRRPASVHWKDVGRVMERSGPDAFPIVALINFLIGLILAFQSAAQLKQFGANIFVADLVGLSVTRELGPLMTAIILAGRSGAAFAAELGTMKVSEEIDALRTLGLSPFRFLVFPRVIGLMLVLPLLTVLADAMGLFGGMVVAVTSLDLTAVSYLNQLRSAVGFQDIAHGLCKSVFFAATIALLACERGLSTRGGAEGVGRTTTAAVVRIIFYLVLLDALFTYLSSLYGF